MVVAQSFDLIELCQQMGATFKRGGGAKVYASPR
jgi:hypothetical protein